MKTQLTAIMLTIVTTAVSANFAPAATFNWTGGGSGNNWDTNGNWDMAGEPGTNDDANINLAGAVVEITTGPNPAAGEVQLQLALSVAGTSTLDIQAGGTLNINRFTTGGGAASNSVITQAGNFGLVGNADIYGLGQQGSTFNWTQTGGTTTVSTTQNVLAGWNTGNSNLTFNGGTFSQTAGAGNFYLGRAAFGNSTAILEIGAPGGAGHSMTFLSNLQLQGNQNQGGGDPAVTLRYVLQGGANPITPIDATGFVFLNDTGGDISGGFALNSELDVDFTALALANGAIELINRPSGDGAFNAFFNNKGEGYDFGNGWTLTYLYDSVTDTPGIGNDMALLNLAPPSSGTPEPSTAVLALLSLAGLALGRRRRQRR